MKKSFALLLGFVLLVSVCGVSLADGVREELPQRRLMTTSCLPGCLLARNIGKYTPTAP